MKLIYINLVFQLLAVQSVKCFQYFLWDLPCTVRCICEIESSNMGKKGGVWVVRMIVSCNVNIYVSTVQCCNFSLD
jgi:hypothetical protein